jgi:hypothetical protein
MKKNEVILQNLLNIIVEGKEKKLIEFKISVRKIKDEKDKLEKEKEILKQARDKEKMIII